MITGGQTVGKTGGFLIIWYIHTIKCEHLWSGGTAVLFCFLFYMGCFPNAYLFLNVPA